MSYRRFVDSAGKVWRVWEVVPQIDRRRAARRVRAAKIQHPERRVLRDRRVDMRRSRLYFPPTESAWLVFETEAEKRRLRPVPAGWYLEDDAGLERLRETAEPQARAATHQG